MHIRVVFGIYLYSQAISIIKGNIDDHGFCHQQQLKATFCVHCGSSFPDSIAVSIVAGENDPSGAYQLFCLTPQWICSGSMTRTYNTTSDTLEIAFIFNHTIHGGRFLRIIRERNGSQENQQILLKPCFSGFTANASFKNESHIAITCQHSSFNYSNSPIRIKIENGTEYGACSKMGCFGCKRLPDGIQCLVPYIPGKAIQCILDGAIYNISAPDIATTTLSQETTETLRSTSQSTSYTSEGTPYTSEGTAYTSEGTSYTSEGTLYTPEGTSYTSEGTSYTSEGNTYTLQYTKLSTTSHENLHISTSTSTENSKPLQGATTIPESSATTQRVITTTVQRSSLINDSTKVLPEGSSTSKSITMGSHNLTSTTPNSVSTEQRFAASTEGSQTSQGTNGSATVNGESTTAYFGTTVKPTNAPRNAITIINQDIIDQGFCDQQDVSIQLYLNCGIPFSATIFVAIVASENENANSLLTCVRSNETTWNCHGFETMTRYFNTSSDFLDINFKFDLTIHTGYYVRVIYSCEGNQDTKHVHLRPCFSGFTVNATFYNETSLIINCQHSSFNYSSSPIGIKLKGGNELGGCSKISCYNCKRLPNGIQCDVLNAPGNIYQCVLDGVIFNISLPTTLPEIQTTTTQNVSNARRVTTPSEYTTMSENSVVTSTDSSSTTSIISTTSSEGSTTSTLFTKTSSEGTTVQTFESTLTGNIQATSSESHSTTESTTLWPEEISTPQNDIESSSKSRENVESTTIGPQFESTSIQSTKIITTVPIDGAAITIINKDDFDRGFCHLNDVEVQLCLGGKSNVCAKVDLSIVPSVYDTNQNDLLTCLRVSDVMWNCHDGGIMTGKYNASSNVLDTRFNFNYTKYAGRYLRIKSFCVGDKDITHHLLKACFSEFNMHYTLYNETSVIINCQHSSFNYSSSAIRIKLKGGDDYGSCSKTSCNSCRRLSEGIQCIVPYTPGKIFQCILDGAVYNISIPTNHVTQTTLARTTVTPERITPISPYRSSTIGMTPKVLESSKTTETFTSPERLSTERSPTAGLTSSTTEETFRPTETDSPLMLTNITSKLSDILSMSPNITTPSPSKLTTSPNTILTSPSIFSTSQRNTMVTATFPEVHTSQELTLIPTTQPSSDESIIIVDKDVLNQGFCHLDGVNIYLNVTCELQSSATLEFYVVANEYTTNTNLFLSCVRYIDGMWNCHGLGSMTAKFNASFDLLELTLKLNYTVYAGHYLRIISSCDSIQDMKNIHLKACFSGFTVNTTFYNESFIDVKCQHSSFNYSNSPIRIKKVGGNNYGTCSRNSCNGCKRLPNGIECKITYILGEELHCILDGAIYNITDQNMMSPEITTRRQHTKTTTLISSIMSTGNSTESLTTTKSTPAAKIPTTSQQSITTKTSIPTTSLESKTTTTNIPTTSQRGITTGIQTTFKESITKTKTKKNPTTHSLTTSTKRSSETQHGKIKSTTPAEITNSRGMSVIQRPLINAAVFLIVVAYRLIYM